MRPVKGLFKAIETKQEHHWFDLVAHQDVDGLKAKKEKEGTPDWSVCGWSVCGPFTGNLLVQTLERASGWDYADPKSIDIALLFLSWGACLSDSQHTLTEAFSLLDYACSLRSPKLLHYILEHQLLDDQDRQESAKKTFNFNSKEEKEFVLLLHKNGLLNPHPLCSDAYEAHAYEILSLACFHSRWDDLEALADLGYSLDYAPKKERSIRDRITNPYMVYSPAEETNRKAFLAKMQAKEESGQLHAQTAPLQKRLQKNRF